MKIKFILLLATGFIQMKCFAQFPAFCIPGSEVRKITSATVAGQEYELQIMLPAGYQNSDKKYPVVYLMDSVLYYAPANKYPLQAAGGTEFYSTAEFLNIRFKKDKQNNPIGFQLETYGGTQWAKKVKQ